MYPARGAVPQYDVFISYRHQEPDQTWVRSRLAPALKAAGFRTCLDVDDFILGYPLIVQMQRAVQHSRYTLVVLSPVYLEGSFARAENVMATLPGDDGPAGNLIVIELQPVPGSELRERARLWLDATAQDAFDSVVERLARELRSTA